MGMTWKGAGKKRPYGSGWYGDMIRQKTWKPGSVRKKSNVDLSVFFRIRDIHLVYLNMIIVFGCWAN